MATTTLRPCLGGLGGRVESELEQVESRFVAPPEQPHKAAPALTKLIWWSRRWSTLFGAAPAPAAMSRTKRASNLLLPTGWGLIGSLVRSRYTTPQD